MTGCRQWLGLHVREACFFLWVQDQVQERSFVAERLTALAASPDGSICAGGGTSGALYAWDVATGRLLRTWPAHYQVPPLSPSLFLSPSFSLALTSLAPGPPKVWEVCMDKS